MKKSTKYREQPVNVLPTLSTTQIPYAFHSDSTAESSDILACVQNFACSIWSCLAGFFSWIGSLFGPAPRNNPELIANPFKHIAADLEVWKDPKGPMTQLLDEVRKCSKDTTVTFEFDFTVMEKKSSDSSEAHFLLFFYKDWRLTQDISALSDPVKLKAFTADLIEKRLQSGELILKSGKAYIDLDREDTVSLTLRAILATPIDAGYSYGNGIRATCKQICISQMFKKGLPAEESKPYLYNS